MKALLRAFSTIHGAMAALFALASLLLIWIAATKGWAAMSGAMNGGSAQGVVEAMGILAAGVVALQIAQTITEEEVMRDAHVSGPTRVRRFLSRFLVVVVVAIVVEALVATFKVTDDSSQLLHVAALLSAAGLLLAGWGAFIRWNAYAEELEPEAMAEAKREDRKLRK
jgi:Ni/Fe-hydrogenase subunit HybB-like protein